MEKIKIPEKKFNKVIIIIVCILFIVFIILNAILNTLEEKEALENIAYEDISNVQEVLSYYKCKYISENESSLEEFYTDIRLVFRYTLYSGEDSNEEFYNNVINDLAEVLRYTSFRLIDGQNDIEIKVICENNEISQILINDIEDYFIYMDSKINLKKYEQIEPVELTINSQEILNLINNNWQNIVSFGTRETVFENYYEFFDEGIRTRTISGKIYNIVFTQKYSGSVVNDIFPGVDLHTVESKLGTPTFEDEENNIIGYKGKEIYVFFTKDQISVYRVSNDETDEFFKLVDKFLNDELELLEFMNQLTYLWPDYSEYIYDSDYVFLSYPLKGIDVKIGYENINGIILYNNANASINKIEKYLEHTEFIANLQVDNVFEAEKRRVQEFNSFSELGKNFLNEKTEEEQEKIGESFKFYLYTDLDKNGFITKINFISKDGSLPNRELSDNISDFLWLNDDILIYSQENVGIFYYNVINGQKNRLVTGNETFKLRSFNNGVLKYDNSELVIEY